MAAALSPARLVAIVGPTASGQSDLALEACSRYNGEVVSCDSVQVYRSLDIGSGKASIHDRDRTPHHLVDILDLHEEMNAGRYAEAAAGAIEDIVARGRLPVVTGGTGLYLTALLKGLFDQNAPDPGTRRRLERLADRHGERRLHRLLGALDPAYAVRTRPADRVRVVRALEVCFSTGRPFSEAQRLRRPAFTGKALIVGLEVPRPELRERVTRRVAAMLSGGLVEETSVALAKTGNGLAPPRVLGAIGYREVVERLRAGALDPCGDDELQRAIVTSTMQYAKRQMTYFRHQFEVEWFAEGSGALDRMGAWLTDQGVARQADLGSVS